MKLHDNVQDKNLSIISLSEEHSYIGVIENTAATNNNKSTKILLFVHLQYLRSCNHSSWLEKKTLEICARAGKV